uniref:(northern house mosquito) hypothetical protein n=1 Tax=Culex pipiens TaxID=7175 RepID=A0A8D8BWM1_CULPI
MVPWSHQIQKYHRFRCRPRPSNLTLQPLSYLHAHYLKVNLSSRLSVAPPQEDAFLFRSLHDLPLQRLTLLLAALPHRQTLEDLRNPPHSSDLEAPTLEPAAPSADVHSPRTSGAA